MRMQVAGRWPQSNLGERRAAHVAVDMMTCLGSGSLEARPGHGSRKPPPRAKDKATWGVCAQVLRESPPQTREGSFCLWERGLREVRLSLGNPPRSGSVLAPA